MKPDLRRAVFRLWTLGAYSGSEDSGAEDLHDPFDVMGFLHRSSASLRSSISLNMFQLQTRPSVQGQQWLPRENPDATETTLDRFSVEDPTTGSRRRPSVTFQHMLNEEMDLSDTEFAQSIEEGSLPTTATINGGDPEALTDLG